MKPLVSILIPAYNAEEWIAATIRSALAQTWDQKEIVVVDDGSTDRTFEVARRFEANGVRVFRQANQGAAAARNTAFSLSRGDYIQWLDADDLLCRHKVAKQMEVLKRSGPKTKMLASSPWGTFMYRPQRAKFVPNALWCDLSSVEFLIRKLQHRVFMQTSVWLVSRELTEAAGPWDNTLAYDDDGEYFCRVLLKSTGVRFVPGTAVYYRSVGATRVSHIGHSTRKLDALWRSMKLHIGYLLSLENSDRARAACVTYLQNYLWYFCPQHPDIVEEMHRTAERLGGQLSVPKLRWKYAWMEPLFGWECAQNAQVSLPIVRSLFLRQWDRMLFLLENRILSGKSDLRHSTSAI